MTTAPNNRNHEAFVDVINTALVADHWSLTGSFTSPPGGLAHAWTSPDHAVYLLLTIVPGKETVADLIGHEPGQPASTRWMVLINDPMADQIIMAAKAAAGVQLGAILRLVDNLQNSRWRSEENQPSGVLCRITDPDGRRFVTCLDSRPDRPGGWVLLGGGLNAEATVSTPVAVIEALARTELSSLAPKPGTAPIVNGVVRPDTPGTSDQP